MLSFNDEVFLVSGASSGIGRQVCIDLNNTNARLIMMARNLAELNKTRDMLPNTNIKNYIISSDLGDVKYIMSCLQELKITNLSGFVNCAGVHFAAPITTVGESDFDHVMNINVKYPYFLIKSLLKKKYFDKGASIVLMSSVCADVGCPGLSVYSLSKGAIESMSKSIASELVTNEIRCNCLAPALVETEMTRNIFAKMSVANRNKYIDKQPLGIIDARAIARSVCFLLSKESNCITGTIISTDAGYRLDN